MSSRDLKDTEQILRDAFPNIKSQFEQYFDGLTLSVTCTHRTPEEQKELFKIGRTFDIHGNVLTVDNEKKVTNIDGTKITGAHNYYPSRAIDVVVIREGTGKEIWDESYYEPLVEICEGLGLESGGSWTSFKDWPHIQIHDFRNYTSNDTNEA